MTTAIAPTTPQHTLGSTFTQAATGLSTALHHFVFAGGSRPELATAVGAIETVVGNAMKSTPVSGWNDNDFEGYKAGTIGAVHLRNGFRELTSSVVDTTNAVKLLSTAVEDFDRGGFLLTGKRAPRPR